MRRCTSPPVPPFPRSDRDVRLDRSLSLPNRAGTVKAVVGDRLRGPLRLLYDDLDAESSGPPVPARFCSSAEYSRVPLSTGCSCAVRPSGLLACCSALGHRRSTLRAPLCHTCAHVCCMVSAAWCLLHGVGCMVSVAWCRLHGVGCMVRQERTLPSGSGSRGRARPTATPRETCSHPATRARTAGVCAAVCVHLACVLSLCVLLPLASESSALVPSMGVQVGD